MVSLVQLFLHPVQLDQEHVVEVHLVSVPPEDHHLLLEQGQSVPVSRTGSLAVVHDVHEVVRNLVLHLVLLLLAPGVQVLVLDHLDRVPHRLRQRSLQSQLLLALGVLHLELVQQVLLVLAPYLRFLLRDGIDRLSRLHVRLLHLLGLPVRTLQILGSGLHVQLRQWLVSLLLALHRLLDLLLRVLALPPLLLLHHPLLRVRSLVVLVHLHPLRVREVVIVQVVLLLRQVLDPPEQVHLVLEHQHCMPTPLARRVPARDLAPFLCAQVETPEVLHLVVPVHAPEDVDLVLQHTERRVAPAAGPEIRLGSRGRVEEGGPGSSGEVEEMQTIGIGAFVLAEASEDEHVVLLGESSAVGVQGVDAVVLRQKTPLMVVQTENMQVIRGAVLLVNAPIDDPLFLPHHASVPFQPSPLRLNQLPLLQLMLIALEFQSLHVAEGVHLVALAPVDIEPVLVDAGYVTRTALDHLALHPVLPPQTTQLAVWHSVTSVGELVVVLFLVLPDVGHCRYVRLSLVHVELGVEHRAQVIFISIAPCLHPDRQTQIQRRYIMFSWFKKKKKQEVKKVAKAHPAVEQQDQWVYEYVLQYLACPVWKAPIQQFIDQNCSEFENTEENKFAYTDVHNRFKALVDGQLERLLDEIGVSGDQLLAVVQKGLKHKRHSKFFEQIIIIDNFMAIKGLMLKRNKQLELEAAKLLKEKESAQKDDKKEGDDKQIQRLELEKDQAEVEHAIMVSIELEKQKKIMDQEEELQIKEAMKISMVSYEKEQVEKVEDGQGTVEGQATQEGKQDDEMMQQSLQEMQEQAQQKPVEESQQEKDFEKVAKRMGKDLLPSLKKKGTLEPLSMDQMVEQRNKLKKQLEDLKTQEDQDIKSVKEDMDQRKKRLQAQRQMILDKKEQERNQEVSEYKQGKESKEEEKPREVFRASDLSGLPGIESKEKGISAEELKRRQDIMSKIKITL